MVAVCNSYNGRLIGSHMCLLNDAIPIVLV